MLQLRFKKLYFILAVITIGLAMAIFLTAGYLNSNNKAKSYFIGRIENFDGYFVNDNYILVNFSGNGSYLYGGIIHKDKFQDGKNLSAENIESCLNAENIYKFKLNNYSDNAVIYIGNYDSDKSIEVFFYEFMGWGIEFPIEITPSGIVQKHGMFNNIVVTFSVILHTLPVYIFVFICSILLLLVLIIYIGIKLLRFIKNNIYSWKL
ncbi:hypothetical protein E4O00_06355 [Treponema sp. OMZ 788]|uniref:hypothetical protein n=1 Tax=Treponema sp. OMZ 788 TaxID=2563664 RepID=UPI0020A40FE5|nr:hypothetical protein [Treponema sp. OMZ 788]UTC65680.1 hypothetical protein E4O00_06355 [Treponema sp. OMZ 788]